MQHGPCCPTLWQSTASLADAVLDREWHHFSCPVMPASPSLPSVPPPCSRFPPRGTPTPLKGQGSAFSIVPRGQSRCAPNHLGLSPPLDPLRPRQQAF